jgi:hypothetical protein
MQIIRREVLTWSGEDVKTHDHLSEQANQAKLSVPEYIKKVVNSFKPKG